MRHPALVNKFSCLWSGQDRQRLWQDKIMAQSSKPQPQAKPKPIPAPVKASTGTETGQNAVFTDFASI